MNRVLSQRGVFYGVMFAILAFLVGYGMLFLQTTRDELSMVRYSSYGGGDNERFFAEYYRFTETLGFYAAGATNVDHDMLMERFDVLWARCHTILDGSLFKDLRAIPGAVDLTQSLLDQLVTYEPMILALKPGDIDAVTVLKDVFMPYDRLFVDHIAELSDKRKGMAFERDAAVDGILARINGISLIAVTVVSFLLAAFAAESLRARAAEIQVRKREREAVHLATHDSLTGLLNRNFMNAELPRMLKVAHLQKRELVLLALDLDGFKEVNDTYGHKVGDLMLQEVANRLLSANNKRGTVVRLGGDEFVIVLVGQDDDEEMLDFVQEIIARIADPFVIENVSMSISVSVGVAKSHGRIVDAEVLYQHADTSLYAAKRAGRNTYRRFDDVPSEPSLMIVNAEKIFQGA